MNIDTSKYYVGSRKIEYATAFQNGKKKDINNENSILPEKPEEIVEYNFGNEKWKMTISSVDELNKITQDIRERHGDGVIVSISGIGLDFLNISKGSAIVQEQTKTLETKELTAEMKQEILKNIYLTEDDEKNILNHSFVNEAFNHQKDFDKFAYGYAKYLNNDISTAYDNDTFYNLDKEDMYKKNVSNQMRDYASNVLSYFMMGKETEEDKSNLSNQLANASIEYAKNIASGNNDINEVETKLKIGEAEMTYGELKNIQSMLQKVNESAVTAVGNSNNRIKYLGLGSNYDTVAYAQLGLRTSQVNYFANNNLSESASNLVKSVWNERTGNTIEGKYENVMKQSKEIIKNMASRIGVEESNFVKVENYYNNSKFQKVYDMFTNIGGNNKEEFLNNFNKVMNDYNEYRNSEEFSREYYVGSNAEKEQLDYLYATKDIGIE